MITCSSRLVVGPFIYTYRRRTVERSEFVIWYITHCFVLVDVPNKLRLLLKPDNDRTLRFDDGEQRGNVVPCFMLNCVKL